MKAIVYTKYGSPDVLKLAEIEKPAPKENEVLVKLKATSINSWDWDMLTGTPIIYRMMFGLFKPKYPVMGIDVAGVVEEVGDKVEGLKVGDEVFGDISDSGFGAFAEYICTRGELLALKPKNASFEDAASLPHGGLLALQSLQFKGEIKEGDKVLINGAGGSSGPLALQMAKQYGAIVTCVDIASKHDLLLSLGSDYVIDYTKEDYTKNKQQYDLIIELKATRSIFAYKRALKKNGSYAVVGGYVRRIFQTVFIGGLISKFTNKRMALMVYQPGREPLSELCELYEVGKLKSIIDSTYPLEELSQAFHYFGKGQAKGKVVISV